MFEAEEVEEEGAEGDRVHRRHLVGTISTDQGQWKVISWTGPRPDADIFDVFGGSRGSTAKETFSLKLGLNKKETAIRNEIHVYKALAMTTFDREPPFLRLIESGNFEELMDRRLQKARIRQAQGRSNDAANIFIDPIGDMKIPFMITTKPGLTLQQLRLMGPRQTLPRSLILAFGLGAFTALQTLHGCGFVHRHVTPNAFGLRMTGSRLLDPESGVVVLDLDQAMPWPIRPRRVTDFRGSVRYASVRIHSLREASPADDVISLIYILVEWLRPSGKLPWHRQTPELEKEVRRRKKSISTRNLFRDCPKELDQAYQILVRLPYSQPIPITVQTLFRNARDAAYDPNEIHWLPFAGLYPRSLDPTQPEDTLLTTEQSSPEESGESPPGRTQSSPDRDHTMVTTTNEDSSLPMESPSATTPSMTKSKTNNDSEATSENPHFAQT